MDKEDSNSIPYRSLGRKLKDLREKAKETLAEASGAVEIDVRQLASYELGRERPTEDILLLLISHFGALDDDAVKVWELAGYATSKIPVAQVDNFEPVIQQQITIALDSRIIFTDLVDVMVNNYGVVMNFMQGSGSNSKPLSIARVGMSREHAKSVLQILQMTLAQTEKNTRTQQPNRLTSPDANSADETPKN